MQNDIDFSHEEIQKISESVITMVTEQIRKTVRNKSLAERDAEDTLQRFLLMTDKAKIKIEEVATLLGVHPDRIRVLIFGLRLPYFDKAMGPQKANFPFPFITPYAIDRSAALKIAPLFETRESQEIHKLMSQAILEKYC